MLVLLLDAGLDPTDGFVAPLHVRRKRVNAFSESEQHVEHLRRKSVGIVRIFFGPIALDGLQFGEPRGKNVAELLDEMQGLLQVAKLVHQVNFGQVIHALVMQLRAVFEPFAQDAVAGWSDLIDTAARAALRRGLAAAEKAFAFEPLQGGIDLAKLGGPEIMEALVEEGFEVVAAGGLAEQAEQDMFEAHDSTI